MNFPHYPILYVLMFTFTLTADFLANPHVVVFPLSWCFLCQNKREKKSPRVPYKVRLRRLEGESLLLLLLLLILLSPCIDPPPSESILHLTRFCTASVVSPPLAKLLYYVMSSCNVMSYEITVSYWRHISPICDVIMSHWDVIKRRFFCITRVVPDTTGRRRCEMLHFTLDEASKAFALNTTSSIFGMITALYRTTELNKMEVQGKVEAWSGEKLLNSGMLLKPTFPESGNVFIRAAAAFF